MEVEESYEFTDKEELERSEQARVEGVIEAKGGGVSSIFWANRWEIETHENIVDE